MNQLKLVGVRSAGGQCDDRRTGVAIVGFDLVDVSKAGGRLKAGGELELPPEGYRVVQKPFDVVRRAGIAFRLDLEALPVEVDASVVVRRDMDIEDENIFVKV